MAKLNVKIAFGLSCFSSGDLLASETAEKVADLSQGITAGYFLKLGVALVLVLCVFFAFAWLMRRLNHMPAGESGLQIVSGLNVGSKEKLMVVQMGEEQVLIGVTQQSISKLHVLKDAIPPIGSGSKGQPVFATLLNNVLNKGTTS